MLRLLPATLLLAGCASGAAPLAPAPEAPVPARTSGGCDDPRPLTDAETAAEARCALASGESPDVRDALGIPALHRLAEQAAPEAVQALLDAGADPGARDGEDATALHAAAAADRAGTVHVLLAAGAEVDARNGSGETPLLRAAGSGGTAALTALVEAGADLEARDSTFTANAAMHHAARAESPAAMRVLAEAGADVDQRAGEDGDAMTALMQAAGFGARGPETIRTLLDLGASVTATDSGGGTALHWAARWDNAETARLLLASGADPDAVSSQFGYTPLHTAFLFSTEAALVPVLLRAGADPRAVTADGRTVLQTAEEMVDSEYADQAAALAALRRALGE